MDKHKIISDMCMTMDHRYLASPEMFKNDPVNKDFTQEYKDGLYRQMKQLFENNIEPLLKNTCTVTERAFLDELSNKIDLCRIWTIDPNNPEIMIGIPKHEDEDEDRETRIFQEDFETNLESLYTEWKSQRS